MADEVVVDSTRKNLVMTLVDENGVAINLTGGAARLTGHCPDLPTPKIDVAGDVTTNPAQGQVTFAGIGALVNSEQMGGLEKATFSCKVKFTDNSGKWDYTPAFEITWVQKPELSGIYNLARQKILDGTLDLAADTLKFMLVKGTYTPDRDHTNVGSLTSHELSGTGYVAGYGGAGRKTAASKTFGVNNLADRAFMDCADPVWTGLNAGTIGYVVLIKEIGGTDANSLPILYLDLQDFLTTGADFTLTVPTVGLLLWG